MSRASKIPPSAKDSTFGFSRKPVMRVIRNGTVLELSATMKAELDVPVSLGEITFFVGESTFPAHLEARYPLSEKKSKHVFKVFLRIPVDSIYDMPVQNSVRVGISDGKKGFIRYLIVFDRGLPQYVAARTQFFRDVKDGEGIVAFFRQTNMLNTIFTVQDANETSSLGNVFRFTSSPKMHVDNNSRTIELHATFEAELTTLISLKEMTFFVGSKIFPVELKSRYPLDEKKSDHICNIVYRIPIEAIYSMPIQNPVSVGLPHPEKGIVRRGIFYNASLKRYKAKHTTFYKDKETGVVAFFRQTDELHTRFTVRHANVTDSIRKQIKIFCAWIISKAAFWVTPVLIFEKNARHYEESGCVVFERLFDLGYKNVWFVLNSEIIEQSNIEKKYRKKIIRQHSFRHYLMFFRCRTFLSTEGLSHALELRCQSNLVQKKLRSDLNTYVFLQHGVMYMVSLNTPERSSRKRKNIHGKPYVVVSSRKEADHFKDYGGYKNKDLIMCGLPKFDRSYLNPGADKILIMPTWRSWEFNMARYDPENTKYMLMIERMRASIPAHLHSKVVVAHHPLFEESTFSSKRTQNVLNYDELLRDVSLLITDYSSIAYDAFYRGANVIFYWEELDECMEHYGSGAHLMITEDTAFGPVCYNAADLEKAVNEVYGQFPQECFQQRYNQIVEFHDGHNTDRLIAALDKKGIPLY